MVPIGLQEVEAFLILILEQEPGDPARLSHLPKVTEIGRAARLVHAPRKPYTRAHAQDH